MSHSREYVTVERKKTHTHMFSFPETGKRIGQIGGGEEEERCETKRGRKGNRDTAEREREKERERERERESEI
jgi:hypothetical protein